MMQRKAKVPRLPIVLVGLMILSLALWQTPPFAESVTIAPSKIVLKAKGQFEDIQAVIRMPLVSGFQVESFEVNFRIGDEVIAQAFAFRYCYIDDNFLASFDRYEIQNHPTVVGLADSTVTATIDGWFVAVAADGQTYRREFSGEDEILIFNPGR